MLHSELWYNPWTSMGSGQLVLWRVSRGSQLHLAAPYKPAALYPHCCPKSFPPEHCFGFFFWQVSPELIHRVSERLKTWFLAVPLLPEGAEDCWAGFQAGESQQTNRTAHSAHQQQGPGGPVSTEAASWVPALPLTVCGALEKLPVSTALCTFLSV